MYEDPDPNPGSCSARARFIYTPAEMLVPRANLAIYRRKGRAEFRPNQWAAS